MNLSFASSELRDVCCRQQDAEASYGLKGGSLLRALLAELRTAETLGEYPLFDQLNLDERSDQVKFSLQPTQVVHAERLRRSNSAGKQKVDQWDSVHRLRITHITMSKS